MATWDNAASYNPINDYHGRRVMHRITVGLSHD
jgi:hypothetical protein